ncbi:MAG TPA: hypothetical protein VIJ72_04920 [Rhizomicrobium sp.]
MESRTAMVKVLSEQFIRDAIEDVTWDLGNKALYDLCSQYPKHDQPNKIAAKIWLIGRSYAVAIERRRNIPEGQPMGDRFFIEVVIKKILNSEMDRWISDARAEPVGRNEISLRTHCLVQNLFRDISGQSKRSLASKYLHFHLPERFFIFDSRAKTALAHLTRGFALDRTSEQHDSEYARFVQRCGEFCRNHLSPDGKALTPRQLDKVLLRYSENNEN